MEKLLTINCILHERSHYIIHFVKEISKLTTERKNKISVNFIIAKNEQIYENYKNTLLNNGIDCKHLSLNNPSHNHDYPSKIQIATSNTNTKYYCKMDEDIFVPINVWNYIIDNLDNFDDDSTLLMSPIISTGIPSVDFFVEQFFDDENKIKIIDMFKNHTFTEMWGCNEYTQLNKHTVDSQIWDYESFYETVNNFDTWMKGIHPVRPSKDAQVFINDYVIENFDRFYEKRDYSLIKIKRPYFCNSFFIINTEKYLKIINDRSLYRDTYDEAPLNLYMKNNNLFLKIINQGFIVHPSYNTIDSPGNANYHAISNKFFDFLTTKI
jgi:hypothetical protein